MYELENPLEVKELDAPRKTINKIWFIAGVFWTAIFVAIAGYWLNLPPSDFPLDRTLNIESGLSAREVTKAFKYFGLIRSELWFSSMLIIFNDPGAIKAGGYTFKEPINAYALSKRITADAPPEALTSVTFPEGFSVKDYAKIAAAKLTDFDSQIFIDNAREFEGFLFPDTYLVPSSFTEEELIELLRNTYNEKTVLLKEPMTKTELTESEIVTLASIVEREANTPESMKIVASILLKRLSRGMPLQADATMEYVLEKPLKDLVAEDLDVESRYNTYRYKGLPPTPIGNPGLQAMGAVILPFNTDYLFYLTDESGNFYYAKTFEEHKTNIARYLK